MIRSLPSFVSHSIAADRAADGQRGIESFLERHADEFRFYASGKAALGDVFAALSSPGENVVVPAYLPDGVVEPIREAGFEPRWYAVAADLGPDPAALDALVDDDTAAVLSVDYFGFPQPRIEEIEEIADRRGCVHVEDAAHAALSRRGNRVFGTRGTVGFTSLHKCFPVPDGAVLYGLNGIDRSVGPPPLSGVFDRYTSRDLRFVLRRLASELIADRRVMRRAFESIVADRAVEPSETDPEERYEAARRPMSRLSRRLLRSVDPAQVRSRRRANYRAWHRVLRGRSDLRPVYDALEPGVCPFCYPVVADRPHAFRSALRDAGVSGVRPWPKLHPEVDGHPDYETATRLSERLLTLPVHQHVRPAEIVAVGRRFGGERFGSGQAGDQSAVGDVASASTTGSASRYVFSSVRSRRPLVRNSESNP